MILRCALVLLAVLPALTGCGPPEELEDVISAEARQAAPATIAPLDPLLTGPEVRLAPEDAEQLLVRGQAAAARANALR